MVQPTRTLNSNNFECYTPAKYIRAVAELLDGIELDPASSLEANKVVQAERFYTLAMNGLIQSWRCRSMFCNPPYGRTGATSNQDTWSTKLIAEYEAGNIEEAVLLVNAATDTSWFQRFWYHPICFTDHRIAFFRVDTAGEATIGSAFIYFGPESKVSRFATLFSEFSPYGGIVRSIAPAIPTLWD